MKTRKTNKSKIIKTGKKKKKVIFQFCGLNSCVRRKEIPSISKSSQERFRRGAGSQSYSQTL